MKVLEITFKERAEKTLPVILSNGRIRPRIYTVFEVKSNISSRCKELWLELDDEPESALKQILADALKRKFAEKCENIDDAYHMFWKALPNKPYDSTSGVTQFR